MNELSSFPQNIIALPFEEYPESPQSDLWTLYTPEVTTFKLWSPVAEEAIVRLYQHGDDGLPLATYPFEKLNNAGVWQLTLQQDLLGIYYTYQIKTAGLWLDETPGIYAQAVGVNGKRAMVLDHEVTNPPGWERDSGPEVTNANNIVLYELHIRDFTADPESGSSMPGKFLGLTETGSRNKEGYSTGLDHMLELGVTHVHLLPSFDFYTVDESRLDLPQYNWGYDPQNYNVPEGSYASDPFKAEVRIREFKQMVKNFHEAGMGVIMDVVFNHTGITEKSNFNLEVPGYYYRQSERGEWSNASGCGNETASERAMMRKFMIESCKYWVKNYHIDGFRFDLMAIHDIETMNLLTDELRKINSSIIIYGEGWTAGPCPLPDHQIALKSNTAKLKSIAAFSDDLRDALKGSVFDNQSRGFVSGESGREEDVKFGIAGCTQHPQLDFNRIHYSQKGWAREPWQSVSFVSCHDNHTLHDKLKISCKYSSEEEIKKMHLLANAVVLTSQGIPFLHAGVEIMRSKGGEHNSYNLPDDVNRIDWSRKSINYDIFEYHKNLISLRKAHPAFRMPSSKMLVRHLKFDITEPGLVSFLLVDHANGDRWRNIYVAFNARKASVEIAVRGEWVLAVKEKRFALNGMEKLRDSVVVPPLSLMVLYQS